MPELRKPSQTAMLAATGRALHLLQQGPRALVQDWLAWPFLGAEAEGLIEIGKAVIGDALEGFCTWFGARARLSDDWLSAAQSEQHIILGAGLDSSAWRNERELRVFEVDHPASQAWKRARAEVLGLPDAPSWVPVDFEEDRLGEALDAAGVDARRGVFVSWHGVIPYLTRNAIASTLRELPSCSLAVGYVPPADQWDLNIRGKAAMVQQIAADLGEPWVSLTTTEELTSLLGEEGFVLVEDIGAADIYDRYGLPALNYERMALATK